MNWYGFIIACGIVICVVSAYFTARKRGIEGDVVIDIIIICLPLAILFARIYYVVFDVIDGKHWTFTGFLGFDDKTGDFKGLEGLAIYGGLIGATIGAVILWLWKNRKKNPIDKRISFMQLLDLGFTFIILGQAIGRWGNFANQEAYGDVITDPSLKFFPIGVYIDDDSSWHYATFFYESMWNVVGFGLLLFLYIGKRKSFDGFVFSSYCIYYGIGRAWIEGMRTDSLWLVPPTDGVGGVRVSQLLSILLIIFGVVYITVHCVRAKKAGKKIFILADQTKLNEDYFGYEKTKLAHPMPDIYGKKKTVSEEVVFDNNGLAVIRDGADENTDGKSDVSTDGKNARSVRSSEESVRVPEVKEEDVYEDKWDD